MLRWFQENFSTLLLAFILALTVWVAAVSTSDPVRTDIFSPPVPIEYTGTPDNLLLLGGGAGEAVVEIKAPESIWERLSAEDIHIIADLSGLDEGEHTITLEARIDERPAQIITIRPAEVDIVLEVSASREVAVEVVTVGDPALGYQAGEPLPTPGFVMVTGPVSTVNQVYALRAELSISGRVENLEDIVPLVAVDADGRTLEGLQLETEEVRVSIQIGQEAGRRLVSVIPIIEGREGLEAAGYYQVTSISVTPSEVIVASSDRQALAELPGYVETLPIDILNRTDDLEQRVTLALPEGISIVGDQSGVMIQIGIDPVVNSINITRPIEIQGLGSNLYAQAAPEEVSLILTGPIATLETLTDEDVRVVVDLLDLGIGTYQLEPQVIILPSDIEYDGPIPATAEVTITNTSFGLTE